MTARGPLHRKANAPHPADAQVAAVILAAGQGKRMGNTSSAVNKPYLPLAGRPVLAHTLAAFDRCAQVGRIVVVVAERDVGAFKGVLDRHPLRKPVQMVLGGRQRQDSARCGLHALDEEVDLVLVHDGVRPFPSAELIERVIRAAGEHGAAVPGLPLSDTVKRADAAGFAFEEWDRTRLFRVQTPQGFSHSLLRYALDEAAKHGAYFTDDAGAVAAYGGVRARIIPGEEANLKITTPLDLRLAEAMLATPPLS